MNTKITISMMARLLAERNGRQQKQCEDFLKSFFSIISNSLEAGENVKVKGLGTFKVSRVESRRSVDVTTGMENEIPAHDKIVFLPSKEMAAAVNAPFEMFETVEISEEMMDEELEDAAVQESDPMGGDLLAGDIEGEDIIEREKIEEEAKEAEEKAEESAKADLALILAEASEPTESVSDKSEEYEEPDTPTTSETSATSDTFETSEDSSETSEDSSATTDEMTAPPTISEKSGSRKFHHGFWVGLVAGIAVIALAGGVFWWMLKDKYVVAPSQTSAENPSSTREDEEALTLASDQLGEAEAAVPDMVVDDPDEGVAPTAPSDNKPVYDTIGDHRYLGTMAKDHYGKYDFWPYIYKENSKILGHPDRIRPGTKVVIPDLSKYGVDPQNPDDLKKAKALGAEIYSRYR